MLRKDQSFGLLRSFYKDVGKRRLASVNLVFFFLLSCCTVTCTDSITYLSKGKAVSITDGDTFTFLQPDNKQIKIRLYGIDSPEKGQPYGTNAKERLSELIFGQQVRIDRKDTDRYGRTVAIVYNGANLCVNEQLLKDGFVWHYRQYDHNRDWDRYEEEARSAHKGLWAGTNPQAPWEWRAARRQKNPQHN